MEPSGELAQRGGGPGPSLGLCWHGSERECVCKSDGERGREGGVRGA